MGMYGRSAPLTALCDCSRCGQVPVLSVHVVGAATRVVTQPDAEVLHLEWGLLVHLGHHRRGKRLVRTPIPEICANIYIANNYMMKTVPQSSHNTCRGTLKGSTWESGG